MPDLTRLVPFSKAIELTPPPRPSPVSMWRWARRGVFGVRLRTYALGRKTFVDPEDLAEFMARVAEARYPPRTPASGSAAGKRRGKKAGAGLQERQEAALQELEAKHGMKIGTRRKAD